MKRAKICAYRHPMRGCQLIAATAVAFAAIIGAAHAQVTKEMRRIGFLSVWAERDSSSQRWQRTFRAGLRDRGWIVGKNIDIAYQWVRGTPLCKKAGRRACVPLLIDDLLARKVELIVVHGGFPARAIQRKAPSMPVVMAEASDAVGRGIVKNLAHPGASITGLTSITPVLAGKRLELLKEVLPGLSRVAVLWTPEAPASSYAWSKMTGVASALGLEIYSLKLQRGGDLDLAFSAAAASSASAIISTSGVVTSFGQKRIVDLTLRHRLPAIFTNRESAVMGGLISYNRNTDDLYRRAATYVDKILRGAKPADLPIEQPTKFSLIVNLRTAKALGITIPRSVLLRADEVIE